MRAKGLLPLGAHSFTVNSSDTAGNPATKTVHFVTVCSIDSLKALVARFAGNKGINNAGIANSLQAKLDHRDLKAFVKEVAAQRGKHITEEAATYLLRDAQYLMA
jgi:DNA polymerase III delta subunit